MNKAMPDWYPTELLPQISLTPGTRPKWDFPSARSLEDPFCYPGLDLDLQGLALDFQGSIGTSWDSMWTYRA